MNRCRDAVRRTSRARSSARPLFRPRCTLFAVQCPAALSPSGAARPNFRRRASFAAPKSYHRSCVAIGRGIVAHWLRPIGSFIELSWATEPAARRIARQEDVPGRPRHRYARHGSPRRRKCPLSRLKARPMTQPDAYRAGRGLTIRLADPRRRRSRAVLLEPTLARKSSSSGARGSNRDRCCPTQRAP